MKNPAIFFNTHFKKNLQPVVRDNSKVILRVSVALIFIALGIIFVKNEHAELIHVQNSLLASKWQWIFVGFITIIVYIFLQGLMYVFSFAAMKHKVSLADATLLFIKRNLVSVFLPAGGISSLVFFTSAIEKKGIKKLQIHFASSIYEFVGILSVVILALPALIYTIFEGNANNNEWFVLSAVILILFFLFHIYRSIVKKGFFFTLLVKKIPAAELFLNDLQNNEIDKKNFLYTVVTSILIEFIGIAQVYIAMKALGLNPSILAATMAYIISVLSLMVSPFLRGLGTVEISMAFLLIRYGYGNVDAVAITFLYRFFEFWIPLFVGVLAFLRKLNPVLMRIIPALFMMLLGIINIVSVLTPAIPTRLHLLRHFISIQGIHDSNYLVLFSGLFILVMAAFMLKGLRTAWWAALGLSIISLVGNITKAIDYEEALFALSVIAILVITRKEYFIKTNPKLRNMGIRTALLVTLAALIYGIMGFYFLSKRHFNIDFTFLQSLRYTLQNYFLIGSKELIPADPFARYFLYSINASGVLSIGFLIYTFARSFLPRENVSEDDLLLARRMVNSYGRSPLDYFKTYNDKLLFFSENRKSFLAYRVSGHFAVVLDNPIAENNADMEDCIRGFDKYCYQNGLGNIFYRIPEESLEIYHKLHKKALLIGQEGVVDLTTFSIKGNSKHSLRNSLNKIVNAGYKTIIHTPPVTDKVLEELKSVSGEWLTDNERSEIIFSQGMFLWEELKQQTIISVENKEGQIIAFVNIIPDYAKSEGTYDLMRKTMDAPNGIMDFMMIELFNYYKSIGVNFVNLGFAPFSGLNDSHTFPEKSINFAYSKIRSLHQHKGIRDFKEKFDPVWYNQYLVYRHDYDLLKIPAVLTNVIKS